MRIITFISSIFVITACSISPDELRRSKPTLETSSTHNSQLISKCITNGWGNTEAVRSDYRPTMFGHTASLYMNDNLVHLIDISNTFEGSKTTIYSDMSALGKESSLSVMQECHP